MIYIIKCPIIYFFGKEGIKVITKIGSSSPLNGFFINQVLELSNYLVI